MLSQKLGWEFYKALRANDTMIVQGHQQVFSTMQQGERVIGAEGAEPTTYSKGQALPNHKLMYPTEGVFFVSAPTAVIKGARNIEAAKVFAEFMISPKAQAMIAAGGIHSARVDVAPPPGQPALADLKHIDIDLDYIETHGKELKAKFNEIFQ
jgi:iron(III) transport system substrate-binding protein